VKFSEETKVKLTEIQAVENKYGLIVFRGGLSYLMGSGHDNFGDDAVEATLAQIITDDEADKAAGRHSCITPEFKRQLLNCAVDLSKFSIWTLFAYIKKYVVVDF